MPEDAANTVRIISLVVFLVASGIVVVVGGLLMRGRIPPNRYFGVRIPATMRNPDLWYRVNAFAGKAMIWMGAVLALLALGLFFFARMNADVYVRVLLLVLIGLSVLYTAVALIYARAVRG